MRMLAYLRALCHCLQQTIIPQTNNSSYSTTLTGPRSVVAMERMLCGRLLKTDAAQLYQMSNV